MKKNQILVIIVLGTALMLPLASSAQVTTGAGTGTTVNKPAIHRMMNSTLRKKTVNNTIAGTVASINGTALTVTDKKGTTYTVDASAAQLIVGFNAPGPIITSIQTGDKIFVTGTVTGASIAAKTIRDQSFVGRIIFNGNVTAVAGTSITINFRKVPYTIDAANAAITSGMGKNAKTITAADIKVGDMLTAFGTLTGTNVTATSIHDTTPTKRSASTVKGKTNHNGKGTKKPVTPPSAQ